MLQTWPALSYHFGITPANFTDLSTAELAQYIEATHDLSRR